MKHGNEVKMRLAWEGKCDGSSPDVTERGQAYTAALNPFHWLEKKSISPNCAAFPFFNLPYE